MRKENDLTIRNHELDFNYFTLLGFIIGDYLKAFKAINHESFRS